MSRRISLHAVVHTHKYTNIRVNKNGNVSFFTEVFSNLVFTAVNSGWTSLCVNNVLLLQQINGYIFF